MTLDDRSRLLHPKHRTGECLRQIGYKEAILSDLLEIIGEDEETGAIKLASEITGDETLLLRKYARNKLRQELREKVKKYCE